jgi:formylglycine-generating enzyme required for sulfatase activity
MGSPENEAGRLGTEGPQNSVRVPDFFIGRFEITREQWRQIARMLKVNIDLQEDPSYFKDSWRQPVEQVSWDEVVEFCKRLEKKTGNPYRLPTEAEWEYAARAVTITPFAFGGTITSKLVNYDSNYPYGLAAKGGYVGKTLDVGNLGTANAFGLFDMHGNVWEWCADVWHNSYGKEHGDAPTNGTAWITGGEQDKHALRGGSWNSDGSSCRSASRFRGGAGDRLNLNGFRVACQAKTR